MVIHLGEGDYGHEIIDSQTPQTFTIAHLLTNSFFEMRPLNPITEEE